MPLKNGITLEHGGSYAPCCYIICKVIDGDWDERNEESSVLVQSDYDWPSIAQGFGWTGFWPSIEAITPAGEYLDEIAGHGIIVEDPGYF